MDVATRIEKALNHAIGLADQPGCPPRLAAAMRAAVFPKGARVRPRLCHAVASACGDDEPGATDAAGAAIELLHCASLVHDDLPCFDDAALRRGRPSIHAAFGEPLAVLAGDALIVLSFHTMARASCSPARLTALIGTVGGAVGVPHGIVAGQAWECEPKIDLSRYHRSKTGALFAAATVCGAAAAGAEDAEAWRLLGEKIGEAYQVADDISDAAGDEYEGGKPVGKDAALGRPSAVMQYGLNGAISYLHDLVADGIRAMPACANAHELRALIAQEAKRLVPKRLAQSAA
ncbi:polyprenyl synthetase family protein [Bradyrhizobium jicamae]|uniref:polyprenyl synthetase family protein n=1 Tax=Bradyrhizobium jicamae TaxID=280332 RepID=UPI001BA7C44F|nr:polyprenyl synthetase family protein [Bradyrhizobium jicamae]MBR0934192.1 polyprenyl synthetase family protein [Bradyrhizobium jicamae]